MPFHTQSLVWDNKILQVPVSHELFQAITIYGELRDNSTATPKMMEITRIADPLEMMIGSNAIVVGIKIQDEAGLVAHEGCLETIIKDNEGV